MFSWPFCPDIWLFHFVQIFSWSLLPWYSFCPDTWLSHFYPDIQLINFALIFSCFYCPDIGSFSLDIQLLLFALVVSWLSLYYVIMLIIIVSMIIWVYFFFNVFSWQFFILSQVISDEVDLNIIQPLPGEGHNKPVSTRDRVAFSPKLSRAMSTILLQNDDVEKVREISPTEVGPDIVQTVIVAARIC